MKNQNIVILGGSGIGMIAYSILERIGGYNLLGFLNDVIPVGQLVGKYKMVPVVGRSEDVSEFIYKKDAVVLVAYIGMTRKQETVQKIDSLGIPEDRLASIVDPSAVIPEGFCLIGPGALICPLAQLSPDTTLGKNCILLPNSFIGHDTILEAYVSVANNAAIGANVRVGLGSHIGTNASIREKVTIGAYSLVGMGAVVLKDVDENTVVGGNPAKSIIHKDN